MDKKLNFVFLFADEMSASALKCYGNPHVRTPNMDQIASEGTKFQQCYVQNPVCSPSRCSLMTGTYVHNRGHRTLWHLLQQDEPSLFRYLKQGGYDIQWFGKNDLYSDAYLSEICDDADQKRAGSEKKPSFGWKGVTSRECVYETGHPAAASFLYKPGEGLEKEIPLDIHVGRAIDYLESRKDGDKPFFLYLPIEMPHPPYTICEPYYHMYDPDVVGRDLMDPIEGKPSYEALIRKYRNLDDLPAEVFHKIYAVYLGMVSYVDYLAGRLSDTLDRLGLKEDTVVIISSDHGDWHGTRRLVEKWPNAMDDELVHVPLIIRMPEGKKGHVVEEQVELFDIMATVLELAGIECGHDHFARSLVSQLRGAAGDRERAVFCEGGYNRRELHCFEGYPGRPSPAFQTDNPAMAAVRNTYGPKRDMQQEYPDSVCRTTMMRTLSYKLVRRTNGEHELYDLSKDPEECSNLYFIPEYRDIRIELEGRMLDWYQETSDTVPIKEDFRFFGK